MTMMNRLANVSNRYQTHAKRVLCVCSAGLLRSPTMANVLHQKFGFNTRAAGAVDEYALVQVDQALMEWADEVVCVEEYVAEVLRDKITAWKIDPDDIVEYLHKITTLAIPDKYEWNHPELVKEIEQQYRRVLNGN